MRIVLSIGILRLERDAPETDRMRVMVATVMTHRLVA